MKLLKLAIKCTVLFFLIGLSYLAFTVAIFFMGAPSSWYGKNVKEAVWR